MDSRFLVEATATEPLGSILVEAKFLDWLLVCASKQIGNPEPMSMEPFIIILRMLILSNNKSFQPKDTGVI